MIPGISVVMPLYNKERDVDRSIDSVLMQSFRDFELIVVDDGSTDSSVAKAMAIQDPRIRLIRQSNRGVSAARNRGVSESRCALVSFIDADDEWLPGFLAKIIELRANYPHAKVYATSYLRRSSDGMQSEAILHADCADFREGILENYFSVAARSDPPIWSSAVAVDRAALKEIGGFPEGVRCGEDLLTWARLAIRWPVAYSKQPLAVFWMPGHVLARPGRFEDMGDPVGLGLRKLCKEADPSLRKGVREYLGMWHRMRAVTELQRNRRMACLRNAWRSMRFGGIELRVTVVGLLSMLPCPNPSRIFFMLKRLQGRQP